MANPSILFVGWLGGKSTMRQLQQSKGAYQRFVFDSLEDVDVDEMATVAADAWSADYVDVVRPEFSPNVLRRMMRGSGWFGVGAWTSDGNMVGYELALPRSVICRGATLSAYYVTAFTVSSQHRRQGLGRWILQGVNAAAFTQHNADLIFSTFHQGHAGSPTVQATFDGIADWAVNRFHRTSVWTRRLDRGALPPADNNIRMSNLVVRDDELALTQTHRLQPPALAELEGAISQSHDVSFALDHGFISSYLAEDDHATGSLWLEIDGATWAFVPYAILPLTTNALPPFDFGQVQGIFGPELNHERTGRVLSTLMHYFREKGCMAAGVFDTGAIDVGVLEAAGLADDDDRYFYAVRGPAAKTALFADVRPPYFIDFS